MPHRPAVQAWGQTPAASTTATTRIPSTFFPSSSVGPSQPFHGRPPPHPAPGWSDGPSPLPFSAGPGAFAQSPTAADHGWGQPVRPSFPNPPVHPPAPPLDGGWGSRPRAAVPVDSSHLNDGGDFWVDAPSRSTADIPFAPGSVPPSAAAAGPSHTKTGWSPTPSPPSKHSALSGSAPSSRSATLDAQPPRPAPAAAKMRTGWTASPSPPRDAHPAAQPSASAPVRPAAAALPHHPSTAAAPVARERTGWTPSPEQPMSGLPRPTPLPSATAQSSSSHEHQRPPGPPAVSSAPFLASRPAAPPTREHTGWTPTPSPEGPVAELPMVEIAPSDPTRAEPSASFGSRRPPLGLSSHGGPLASQDRARPLAAPALSGPTVSRNGWGASPEPAPAQQPSLFVSAPSSRPPPVAAPPLATRATTGWTPTPSPPPLSASTRASAQTSSFALPPSQPVDRGRTGWSPDPPRAQPEMFMRQMGQAASSSARLPLRSPPRAPTLDRQRPAIAAPSASRTGWTPSLSPDQPTATLPSQLPHVRPSAFGTQSARPPVANSRDEDFGFARRAPASDASRVIDQSQATGRKVDVGWGRRSGGAPPSEPSRAESGPMSSRGSSSGHASAASHRSRSPSSRPTSSQGPPSRPPSAQAAPKASTGWTPTPSPPPSVAPGRLQVRRESPPPRPAPYLAASVRDGGESGSTSGRGSGSSSYRQPSPPPPSRPSTASGLSSRPPSTCAARVSTCWTPTPSPPPAAATARGRRAASPVRAPPAPPLRREPSPAQAAVASMKPPAATAPKRTGWTPTPSPPRVGASVDPTRRQSPPLFGRLGNSPPPRDRATRRDLSPPRGPRRRDEPERERHERRQSDRSSRPERDRDERDHRRRSRSPARRREWDSDDVRRKPDYDRDRRGSSRDDWSGGRSRGASPGRNSQRSSGRSRDVSPSARAGPAPRFDQYDGQRFVSRRSLSITPLADAALSTPDAGMPPPPPRHSTLDIQTTRAAPRHQLTGDSSASTATLRTSGSESRSMDAITLGTSQMSAAESRPHRRLTLSL